MSVEEIAAQLFTSPKNVQAYIPYARGMYGADAGELWRLVNEEIPVCVATDGLGVLDDVGGVPGFCRFLREIHENPDREERDSWRTWARSLGWTGRRYKPERML